MRKNLSLNISLGIENFVKKEIIIMIKNKRILKLKLYLLISNKAHKIPTSLTNACTIF